MEEISGEEAELGLHHGDGVDRMRFADGGSRDFAKTDATYLARLDVFRNSSHGGLDRRSGIDTRRFKDVDETGFVQYLEAIVDAPSDAFGGAVGAWRHAHEAAFDTDDDGRAVLGMVGEIVSEELEGVGCWGSVELAGVPEVGAVAKGGLEDFGSVRVGGWRGAPC